MDDDDRDSNASSYNEQDENMDDADEIDVDNDPEPEEEDNDNEEEEQDDDEGDNEDENEDTQDPTQTGSQRDPNNASDPSHASDAANAAQPDGNPAVTQPPATPQNPTQTPTGPASWQLEPRPETLNARLYDIVPTMAAPQATSINAMAITPDMRYWMTGGSDGYVRKYDGVATINGKQLLTVAQRHPFVDSVTKAGVLMSYWENFEPPSTVKGEENVLSPVYSLAVSSQALWCLAGLESGGINMQTVRHLEGTRIAFLQKHSNAVSVLSLAPDEQSVLSGSWDKTILDWDLNTGDTKRSFDGSGGQISAIEVRPSRGAPIPLDDYEVPMLKSEFSNFGKPLPAASFSNGIANGLHDAAQPNGTTTTDTMGTGAQDNPASPAHESLFGGGSDGGSLFGDTDGIGPTFGGDDDEFTRAMEMPGPSDQLQPDNGLGENSLDMNNMGDPIGDDSMNAGALSMDMSTFDPDSAPPPAVQPLSDKPGSSNMSGSGNWTSRDAPDPVLALADPAALSGSPSAQPPPSEPLAAPLSTLPGSQPPPGLSAPMDYDVIPPVPSPGMHRAGAQPAHLDPSQSSDSTFMTAAIDGTIRIWDRRVELPVARIGNRPGVPPWCMGACWSPDGNTIYAGRRNGTVEEFSIHKARSGWEPERTLKFPAGSGAVSAVRPMPNGRHLVCASHDILRLYDLRDQAAFKHSTVPFLIIPGPPKAGVISQLWIDPTSRFMVSAAGTRGWDGTSTEVLIGYEIGVVNEI